MAVPETSTPSAARPVEAVTIGPSSKLAAAVADQIIGKIARARWPEGEVIGSEAELLEEFGVSRAILREAIRLLEHLEVARMRRGPGGGLVVLPPSLVGITDALSVYLIYVEAEIEEVFDARLVLEELAAELASSRLTESAIDDLRALIERERSGDERDHRELHRMVARVTGNPALEILVDLLDRVSLNYLPGAEYVTGSVKGASAKAHVAIAESILGSDAPVARRRMRKHLEAEADFLRKLKPSLKRLGQAAALVEESDKLAERTARQIIAEVADAGWPVGELLGSEADLMERFDVSRAVLREAIRLLEHHQVARTRRGPGGGLFVTAPGIDAVAEAMAIHIGRAEVSTADLFEVRRAVEMVVLDRAVDRLDDESRELLVAALAHEQTASRRDFAVVGHDLHAVIASVSGNRVLELLTRVLVRLTRTRTATPAGAKDPLPTGEVTRVHQRIVEALLSGDADLARHRMRKHLDALSEWTK